jgi:hypothetical protein
VTEVARPAAVVMAHADPVHLQRLLRALAPWPVALHIDINTAPATHGAMTARLPAGVHQLTRLRTGWARWENVEAELNGYRAVLADPDVTHIVVMTGSDYPLASTRAIEAFLGDHARTSFANNWLLPAAHWGGRSGGIARLRYPHWAVRKRMIRVPLPRRLPPKVTLAAGSQMKVLARHHAEAVLAFHDSLPSVVRFWRRSWCADESFVPSALETAVPRWSEEHVRDVLWFIDWNRGGKSPGWLTAADLPQLRALRFPTDGATPRLFARKFSSDVDPVAADLVDAELRSR